MKPERAFGVGIVLIGAIVVLADLGTLRVARRCADEPLGVTLEELEERPPASLWVRLESIPEPQPAPVLGTLELVYPLRSSGRSAEKLRARVFVSRRVRSSEPPPSPRALQGPVIGMLSDAPGFHVDSLPNPLKDQDESRLVVIEEGETPPSRASAYFWLALGLSLVASGIYAAALAPATGRSAAVGWVMRVVTPALGIGGAFLCLSSFAGFVTHDIGMVLFSLIPGVLGLVGYYVLAPRALKHLAASADEILALDRRPPVLYLRSFQADEIAARETEMFGKTEEELVVEVLDDFGPVVAIGKPGEELPTLGAARLYVSDGRWQEVVADYMDRSALVALRLGQTMGFWWELERTAKKLDPTRLLILTPYDRDGYEEFKRQAEGRFGRPLPEFVAPSDEALADSRLGSLRGAIFFGPDWSAQYRDLASAQWPWPYRLGSYGRAKLVNKLRWSLRPIYARQGVPWWSRVRWGSVALRVVPASAIVALFGTILADVSAAESSESRFVRCLALALPATLAGAAALVGAFHTLSARARRRPEFNNLGL